MITGKMKTATLDLDFEIDNMIQSTKIAENLDLGSVELEDWSLRLGMFFHQFMNKLALYPETQFSGFVGAILSTSDNVDERLDSLQAILDNYDLYISTEESEEGEESHELNVHNFSDYVQKLTKNSHIASFEDFVKMVEGDKDFQKYMYGLYCEDMNY